MFLTNLHKHIFGRLGHHLRLSSRAIKLATAVSDGPFTAADQAAGTMDNLPILVGQVGEVTVEWLKTQLVYK